MVLPVKILKISSETVTNYWTKFKRVYQNIWKPREDFSLDSISCQMKNCFKFSPKLKTHKLCKDTLINVLKVLVN